MNVMLLDGGFSSQLSYHLNMTVEDSDHPLWSARFLSSNKNAVINTHRDFIRAGSDIVITNSYQASVEGFQKYLEVSPSKSIQLIKDSVRFVREAIKLEQQAFPSLKKKIYVAGSVGSYGACLHDGSEYRGEYVKKVSVEEMKNWHRPRIAALVDAGVDYLAFETIPAAIEMQLLVELLREYPGQKAWLSFSCKDGIHTCANDFIGASANKLWNMNPEQIAAIGMNCLHPSLVSSLVTEIKESSPKFPIPTIVYPNNGESYDTVLKKWNKHVGSPTVDSYVPEWLKLGVSIIGGCCKTTASDIAKFKTRIMEHGQKGEFPQPSK